MGLQLVDEGADQLEVLGFEAGFVLSDVGEILLVLVSRHSSLLASHLTCNEVVHKQCHQEVALLEVFITLASLSIHRLPEPIIKGHASVQPASQVRLLRHEEVAFLLLEQLQE